MVDPAAFLVVTAFWTSVLVIGFTYVGYPVLLVIAARLFGRRPVPPRRRKPFLPRVSVLVVAHNEEEVMEQRVQNALALDYPRHLLEIVVASDGSTDATNSIVRAYERRGVRLLAFPNRSGKSAVLNSVIPRLRGTIVVLSDANTLTEADSVRKLVRWFSDPRVGVVCGKLQLIDRATGNNVDGIYWRVETTLKRLESYLGAVIGVNGANYAIRRSMFTKIPGDTIVDDLVLPLAICLRRGCTTIFDADALAVEETGLDMHVEFERRARIGAGGFQAIALLWRLLDPRRGWTAAAFLCHKVLRWTCPFFLLALLLLNVALAQRPAYRLLFAGQIFFHGGAAVLMRIGVPSWLPRPMRLLIMFHSMNHALLIGFWRWRKGRQSAAWKPTARNAPALGAVAEPGD
jgi:cellulose synthase/poly-beta-1,6-N-acetylglucosamine synthase-like glycosyltransferase